MCTVGLFGLRIVCRANVIVLVDCMVVLLDMCTVNRDSMVVLLDWCIANRDGIVVLLGWYNLSCLHCR